jgi:prepilin-type processing-associated H-X9-DG protein
MTQPSPINCPHCGQPIALGPEQVGQTVQCVHCGKSFAIASSPPDVGTYPGAAAKPGKENPFAILSFVCGLIACVPFVSVLAIIFGIVGLKKTKDPRVSRKGTAIAGILLGCVGVLANVPVVYVYVMMKQTSDRVRSAGNLSQIGKAILAYTNDNRGRYPPDLGELVKTRHIPVADFLCPSMPGGSSLPSNLQQMTIAQQAAWVNQNADVVYVGAGLTQGAPAETIVLYEKHDERNSPPDGSFDSYEVQMLFADGHVEPVPTADAHRRISDQMSVF